MSKRYTVSLTTVVVTVVTVAVLFIGAVFNFNYGYKAGVNESKQDIKAVQDKAYEQGHYDALKEAHDTYGLEADFDGYSQDVKKGGNN